MDTPIKTILFVGPTGSGKGAQSELLSKKTGFPVFSTGDRYREIRDSGSYLGERIKAAFNQGYLMPGWFSTFLFQEALLYKSPSDGVICEGVGRTLFETQAFEEVMQWLDRPYVVFCITISEEESRKRQLARGRLDSDSEEKLRVRFDAYTKDTAPAIEYLRTLGKVIDIEGERSVEEIHADIVRRLGL
jgi:adenylate kinase